MNLEIPKPIFVKTQKGGEALLYCGYRYTLNKKNNDATTLQCIA